jgi:hypothetical protein
MEDLIAAGAPPLPDGMFYRVRLAPMNLLRVEIRSRWWLGSLKEESVYVSLGAYRDGTEAVVSACELAAYDLQRHTRITRVRQTISDLHAGDHDPRRAQ